MYASSCVYSWKDKCLAAHWTPIMWETLLVSVINLSVFLIMVFVERNQHCKFVELGEGSAS